jgi:hypothetical protein
VDVALGVGGGAGRWGGASDGGTVSRVGLVGGVSGLRVGSAAVRMGVRVMLQERQRRSAAGTQARPEGRRGRQAGTARRQARALAVARGHVPRSQRVRCRAAGRWPRSTAAGAPQAAVGSLGDVWEGGGPGLVEALPRLPRKRDRCACDARAMLTHPQPPSLPPPARPHALVAHHRAWCLRWRCAAAALWQPRPWDQAWRRPATRRVLRSAPRRA